MTKKKSAAEGSSESAEASKKAKKPAAKKPAAKKSAAKGGGGGAKKAAPRAKRDTASSVAPAPVEVLSEGEALNDVIEAEIVAETPAEELTASAPELTDEERELSAIYGEDTTGTPSKAHSEFSDQKSRDEDRPMMPEINAREERKAQWQDRRDRRKQRRDERQQRRDDRGGAQGGGAQAGGGQGGGG